MNTARLIHQQVVQIRWPLLVCLGLIMVLPLEEAVVNAANGEGFYSSDLFWATYALAPLLAGLIACAVVQADLDERLYPFWRSKPVGVKFFMALKYAVGLCLALAVPVVPTLFAVLTTAVVEPKEEVGGIGYTLIAIGLVSLLGYSLCFLCNVVIRKTARAWLVGMAGMLLFLLVPFLLPLDYRDVFADVLQRAPQVYLVIILVGTAAAFAASLTAARRDWRMETNLKWLLWAGAGVVFLVLMLFAGQVANIRVVDTRDFPLLGIHDLVRVDGDILLQGRYAVDVEGEQLVMTEVDDMSDLFRRLRFLGDPTLPGAEGDLPVLVLWEDMLFEKRDGRLYVFAFFRHYEEERTADDFGRSRVNRIDRQVFLRSFEVTEDAILPLGRVDLSEGLTLEFSQIKMRLIDGKIAAVVGNQAVTVDVADPAALEVIGRKPMRRIHINRSANLEQYTIPLIAAEGIDVEERIRFSIDFYHSWQIMGKHSVVDIRDGVIDYYLSSFMGGVLRYRVVDWDDESIYTERQGGRPFTIVEQLMDSGDGWMPLFVEGGKLYDVGNRSLVVYDVRSEPIRKIGHFERIADDFHIQEAAVTPGGQILLTANRGLREFPDGRRESYGTLYLLENPE